MITDAQSNYLFLADTLPVSYPAFFPDFEKAIIRSGIPYAFLPGTKDVWAVNYMPVQIAENNFVQFRYNPVYLRSTRYLSTITNTSEVCKTLGIQPKTTDLILDGGNLVHSQTQVILTDRVLKDNPQFSKQEILRQLHHLLQVEHVHLIPEQAHDFTGHADGMLRYLDEHTLLINDYSKESQRFQNQLKKALAGTHLDLIEIPYPIYENPSADDASGAYINYLLMKDHLFLPVFEKKEDDAVFKQFQSLFPRHQIHPVLSNSLAKSGGILNCISWNVYRKNAD